MSAPAAVDLVRSAHSCTAARQASKDWLSATRQAGASTDAHMAAGCVQAASTRDEASAPGKEAISRSLHVQAAKVVAAHAASVGDALLGVPLLCSAGWPSLAFVSIWVTQRKMSSCRHGGG